MSQKTKFDRKLEDFFVRSQDRLNGLVLDDPLAESLKALAQDALKQGEAVLRPAVAKAIQENHNVYLASEQARAAEARVEAAYEPLHLSLEQVRIQKSLSQPNSGAAFAGEQARVGAAMTPAAFRLLGLDQTLSVGETVTTFAQQHLPGDHPQLLAMVDALQGLGEARGALDEERGEAANAMRALEVARNQSRNLYAAARAALRGGLRLAGRPEPLRTFIPSLRAIYATSSAPTSPTGAPNVTPTPTPVAPPSPDLPPA